MATTQEAAKQYLTEGTEQVDAELLEQSKVYLQYANACYYLQVCCPTSAEALCFLICVSEATQRFQGGFAAEFWPACMAGHSWDCCAWACTRLNLGARQHSTVTLMPHQEGLSRLLSACLMWWCWRSWIAGRPMLRGFGIYAGTSLGSMWCEC